MTTATPSGQRPQFQLFLPQMQLDFPAIVDRARAAEGAGFDGVALMDHLVAPAAVDRPAHEAMVAATWIAAHTERLGIGHLVLCDAFRHPAVLAKQAVSLDHASGGRFELGIGWGSYPPELERFGVGELAPARRVARLAETLEVLNGLWKGERVEHHGEFFDLTGAGQAPTPLGSIPIVIGGAGRRTLELVARYADWWNLPVHEVHRLDELRPAAGSSRVSVQQMITFIGDGRDATEIESRAERRFGWAGERLSGSAAQLVDQLGALASRGVERVYCWFTDFADPDTLAEFGETVIGQLGSED